MCFGPTSEQSQMANGESSLFNTMSAQAKTIFGDASSVFSDIYGAMSPIVKAGPNQEGFSGAEKTAMNSQATDGTAKAYGHAARAVGEAQAAQGGGNDLIPAGAKDQLQGEIAANAAGQESTMKQNVIQADYATGRSNWLAASNALAGAPSVFNAATAAGEGAAKAGDVASNQINKNAEASSSWMGLVGGVLGTAAGAALGPGGVVTKMATSGSGGGE